MPGMREDMNIKIFKNAIVIRLRAEPRMRRARGIFADLCRATGYSRALCQPFLRLCFSMMKLWISSRYIFNYSIY